MKREMLCFSCNNKLMALHGSRLMTDSNGVELVADPYPGEHVKHIRGNALRTLLCDQCNKVITENELCWAVSIWADYGGIPYYPWEDEFLKVGKP